VNSITGKQAEHQQAQQQSHEELLKKGTEVLTQKIPNWGKESQEKLKDYAVSLGFSEAQVNSLVDPIQVETLWKASQYDALQEGKTAAVKKVQTAPTIKPKSRNPMPKEVGDKLNLRKKMKSNQTNKAKANALGDHLANKFGF